MPLPSRVCGVAMQRSERAMQRSDCGMRSAVCPGLCGWIAACRRRGQ